MSVATVERKKLYTLIDRLPDDSDASLEDSLPETVAALLEARRLSRDPHARRYSDVEEALRELKR